MSADSADAGEVRPAAAGVSSGLRVSGFTPRVAPVLPGRLNASSDGRRKKWLLLGTQRMPEVGGGVHCPLVQVEVAGGLLVA